MTARLDGALCARQAPDDDRRAPDPGRRTYVQFIVDEWTGQIKVNFIDTTSGQVVQQIAPTQLQGIIENYLASRRINEPAMAG